MEKIFKNDNKNRHPLRTKVAAGALSAVAIFGAVQAERSLGEHSKSGGKATVEQPAKASEPSVELVPPLRIEKPEYIDAKNEAAFNYAVQILSELANGDDINGLAVDIGTTYTVVSKKDPNIKFNLTSPILLLAPSDEAQSIPDTSWMIGYKHDATGQNTPYVFDHVNFDIHREKRQEGTGYGWQVAKLQLQEDGQVMIQDNVIHGIPETPVGVIELDS